MKHCVLCVDDEVDNVDALERLFRRKYRVLKATSALEAIELLKANNVSVIISDQRMPHMTGVELLAESVKLQPSTIRILLTGYTDIDSVIGAINKGHVYRYVTKPWDPVDLSNAVDKAIERFEIGEELIEKNRALELALSELRTLDQAKSQFMILVNHELKTPLTSMLSFAELLAETQLLPEQTRMLSRIRSAALRLQEMINDALEYVSAETAQTMLDCKTLPAARIFSETQITEPIRKFIQDGKVTIKFSVTPAQISGDEKVLINVFRRLLHNACKFAVTEASGAAIVTVTGNPAEGNCYEIKIRNPSLPIDDKVISSLLKPFTLNENVLNHTVGTGLGLSISQALLKLHGSKLGFTSGKNEVAVTFKLPLS